MKKVFLSPEDVLNEVRTRHKEMGRSLYALQKIGLILADDPGWAAWLELNKALYKIEEMLTEQIYDTKQPPLPF